MMKMMSGDREFERDFIMMKMKSGDHNRVKEVIVDEWTTSLDLAVSNGEMLPSGDDLPTDDMLGYCLFIICNGKVSKELNEIKEEGRGKELSSFEYNSQVEALANQIVDLCVSQKKEIKNKSIPRGFANGHKVKPPQPFPNESTDLEESENLNINPGRFVRFFRSLSPSYWLSIAFKWLPWVNRGELSEKDKKIKVLERNLNSLIYKLARQKLAVLIKDRKIFDLSKEIDDLKSEMTCL